MSGAAHRFVMRTCALALLVALAGCSPPGTPVGATVFRFDASGAIPPDVARRVRPLAPVHDGCAVPLQGGKEEVRIASTSVRDPTTARTWLQEVTVTVSKNVDTRIEVSEVRPLLSASPEHVSDGVSLRVMEHETGGSFTVGDVSVRGDGTCVPR